MLHIAYIAKSTPSGRGTTVRLSPTRKRPSALFGLWCLTAVFASAKRMRKLTANAIGGKPVRARQEPDGQRLEREIRVFPALALTVIKNYKRHDLDASFGESVGFMERSYSGTE